MFSISPAELKRREAIVLNSVEAFSKLENLPPAPVLMERAFGIAPDPWQRRYLLSSISHAAIAVVACRQTGKSTVAASFAAWCMLAHRGFVILVCSRSLRQAAEFISKVKIALFSVVAPSFAETKNTLGIALMNGSKILAVPCQGADAARGFSPDLLLVDEAAFVGDDVFTALTPSLTATRGALHMISSPNGRAGMFFDAVEGKVSKRFQSFRVRADHIGRFDPKFLELQKDLLGDLRYRQEFMAEFLTMEGAFFNAETTTLVFRGEEIDEADLTRADYTDIVQVEVDDLMAAFDVSSRRVSGVVGYA